MNEERRIKSLAQWGNRLREDLEKGRLEKTFSTAYHRNPWFTPENSKLALKAICDKFLNEEQLKKLAKEYDLSLQNPLNIGLVMAGNIPMAGFHDLLCVLVSGHKAIVKLSSKDDTLMPLFLEELYEIEPAFKEQVETVDLLKNFDAVIATGSDNSSRYFEYYFGKYPHIIRKNRVSAAVLNGGETEEDLRRLGQDIFAYFGLGCRNVSKLFVPEDYDLQNLFKAFEIYRPVIDHNKYRNNYDFQKSRLLVNKVDHQDTGFLLFEEVKGDLVSPMATLYYERVDSNDEAFKALEEKRENIQCVASLDSTDRALPVVKPGATQYPGLFDYPDDVDIMKFLTSEIYEASANG